MQNSLQSSARPARIVVLISHLQPVAPPSRLATEVQSVLPAFADTFDLRVDIRVVDRPFAEALSYAQELEQNNQVDVLICTGATGAFLRKHLSVPVVLMPVADYDVLQALERARRVSDRVAILSYRNTNLRLEQVQALLTVSLRQEMYTSLAEASQQVQALAAAGYQVIVGSSMVTELAEQAGLSGVLITSSHAALQALDDAMTILRSARAEIAKRQRLNTLLQHLTDGVLAVDMEGKVQAINPTMAALLDVSVDWALQQSIAQCAPQLDLTQVLRTGAAEDSRIIKLGSATIIVKVMPIIEDGRQTGAVLTCQETSAVQRADRQIRRSTRPGRLLAKYRLDQIHGESRVMRDLLALAQRYAQTDSTILINGESGTGKELLAQGIHNASGRRKGPFVAINCAAFPETLLESELFGYEEGAFSGTRKGGKPGLFEMAHTGTIFLDEIGDMPLALQTRLLRVLQEREVVRLGSTEPTPIDVRILAATHHNLRQRIVEQSFREDLYYRLNILRLKLPPLRERAEDIAPIATHILNEVLQRSAGDQGFITQSLQQLLPYLKTYAWPGNIRELENVIERTVLALADRQATDPLNAQQLRNMLTAMFEDEEIPVIENNGNGGEINLKALAKITEMVRIRKVLDECSGNLERASQRLGISRTTLWRRLNADEIEKKSANRTR